MGISSNLVLVKYDGQYFANTKSNDFVIYTPSNLSQNIYIGVGNGSNEASFVVNDETATIQSLHVTRDVDIAQTLTITGHANFVEPVKVTEIIADVPVNVQGMSFSNSSFIGDNITFSNNLIGNNVGVSNVDVLGTMIVPQIQNNNLYVETMYTHKRIRFCSRVF